MGEESLLSALVVVGLIAIAAVWAAGLTIRRQRARIWQLEADILRHEAVAGGALQVLTKKTIGAKTLAAPSPMQSEDPRAGVSAMVLAADSDYDEPVPIDVIVESDLRHEKALLAQMRNQTNRRFGIVTNDGDTLREQAIDETLRRMK